MSDSRAKDGERINQYRRDSRRLLAIGAFLVIAGVTGGYVHPGLVNPVETTRGAVAKSQFIAADGGRFSLAKHRLTAILTVDYVVDGKARSLNESVSTSAGSGEQLYSVGSPITVYIRRGKSDTYATLAKPKPLIFVWIGMVVFGIAWIVLGWLLGRPVGSNKKTKRSREG